MPSDLNQLGLPTRDRTTNGYLCMDSKTATNLLSTKTLVQFGLNRQPFMDKGNNRYVFEDSAISTQINVLINIIHGSDKIVMIKGENGVGKSSLLHKLAKIRHKGLTFCPIKATDKITIESLCKIALKHLEIPAPSSSASIPEFFAKRVAFRRRTEGKTVLLIDDADQLDSYTIDKLLLLRKLVAEDGVPAISIVFSGHPQLEQILTALPRINSHLSILHTIYLYPFSEKQTIDYINQRLQFACNNQDIELLTPAQIQSIHNRSKGIPALINYETCKILETVVSKGKNPIEPQATDTGKTSQLIPALLITVATLSLGFIGYLAYNHIQQSNINQEPTSVVSEAITIPSKIVTPFKQDPIIEQPAIEIPTGMPVTPVNEPIQDLQEASNERPPIKYDRKNDLEKKEESVASKAKELIVATTIKPAEGKELKIDKQLAATITDDAKKAAPKIKVQTDTTSEKTVSEKVSSEETVKSPTTAEKQINTSKKMAKEKTQQVSIQKPSAKKPTTDTKQLAASQTKIAQAKKEETKKLPAAKTTAKTTAVKPAINKKPTATPKQVAATVEKTPSSKVTKPSSSTEESVRLWIKKQPPMDYTMQLLASQNDTALIKYKQQNPALKNAKIASTLRKGKSWYVLIVGSFKTTTEAKRYLSKQPAPINKSKPWIRRFKPLQQTLK